MTTRANDLLTVEDVAQIIRSSPAAVHMQRQRGDEPGSLGFKVGKRVLFDPADLTAYIEGRKDGTR